MLAPNWSSCTPISSLIERLKLKSATAVPMPIAIPAIRKAAFPFRRLRFANAIVVILKYDYLADQYGVASRRKHDPIRALLKVFRAGFDIALLNNNALALLAGVEPDWVATAGYLADQGRRKLLAAIVTHHVIALLVIAL